MKKICRIAQIFSLLCYFSISLFAQTPANTWTRINQGLAKCAQIGEWGGDAEAAVDGMDFRRLLDRRGETFLYMTYNSNGSNQAPCPGGLFRHDTVNNQWIKVANAIGGGFSEMFSNNTDIFACVGYGNILKFNPDYAANPDGWEVLTPPGGLRGSDIPGAGCIQGLTWGIYGTAKFPQVAGDTIFFLFEAPCGGPNRIAKFNVNTKTITTDILGPFPHQGIAATGGATTGMGSFFVSKAMGGIFKYFMSYPWFGSSNASRIPFYLWVFDPRNNAGWRNISEGINWMNITGSSNPPQVGWGPCGHFTLSHDKRSIFAASETGIYKWLGNGWEYLGANRENTTLYPTEYGVYVRGRGYIEILKDAVASRIGDQAFWSNPCPLPNGISNLVSPDNGKTLYAIRDTRAAASCGNSFEDGVFRLQTDSTVIGTVRNIHLNAGTYLGGPGNNNAVNVGIGGKFHVFVGGNFPSVTSPNPFPNVNLHNATSTSRGRIIHLSANADSVLGSINLGNRVDDFEIQNFGQYRMVVTGDFGVSVIDSTGRNLLWNIPSASLPGNASDKLLADIDDQGHVVVLRSKIFRLFDQNGQALCAPTPLNKNFVNDITLKNDTVYVTGFQNDFLGGQPQGCGEDRNLPVQVAFVFAYKRPANSSEPLETIFTTFNFRGAECGLDQADTRGYKINVGKDGKVYYLGEAAGGNSIYRWNGKTTIELNGCTNPPSTLVQYDTYNQPFNTASAHIAYFCTINPRNGEIERGQYIIPRLSNGRSNTYRVRDAYVHADQDGFVYIGGVSASAFAGRNVQKVNGQPIGTYAGGDMCALVVTPNYLTRTFWGTFSQDTATGEMVGFGIRGKRIVAVGNTDRGKMHTKNALIANPFDPRQNNNSFDVYLALWGQELWRTANNDSIINTVIGGNPVITPDSLLIGARFRANRTTVCTDSVVVFTDESIGATSWVWDFGAGASLAPGTIGKGPHFVSYSTPGLKTVKLTINNNLSVEEKFNYLLVQHGNLQLGAISGPGAICAGGIATYSVSVNTQQSWGITGYNWSLPPGSMVLSGANSPTIRVRFGSVSGQLSVRAAYGCGLTPPVSRAIAVDQGPGAFEAFFVVDRLFLTPGEQAIRSYLQTNGYNVQTVEDNNYNLDEALCKSLVVISSSVNPALIDTGFANLPGALVVLHGGLFSKLKLAAQGATGISSGLQNIDIVNAGHPLAAGFPAGSLNIFQSNQNITWANLSATAVKVATIPGESDKAVLFAYNPNSALPGGGTARNTRVGLFAENNLNTNGLQLLQKALCWSGNFCDLPGLRTDSLNAYFYCQSSELKVKFTANGTFNAGNVFTLQLSDAFGSFVSFTNLATMPGQSSGEFTIQLPAELTTGNRYALRVVSSSPAVVGTSQANITLSRYFDKTLVFIGDASLPNANDNLVINRLRNFHGYEVSYFGLANVQEKDLKCRAAIYISNTARTDQQPAKWDMIRSLDIPMFIAHHGVLQRFGLTSNNSVYPTENQGSINVVNTNHPITYNMQTGLRPVYNITGGADLTTGGLLRGSAIRLANSPTNQNHGSVFIYEKDSLLWDGKGAAERRTVFFLNYRRGNSTFNTLTESGLRLFDQAVCYTGQKGCQVITTLPLLSGSSLCVGTELRVPFEISGFYPFSSENRFFVELSDPNGSFANPIILGSHVSQANRDTITLQIPGNVAAGTGYRVRVTASDGAVFFNNLSGAFAITSQQAPIVQVSGTTTLCAGDSVVLTGPANAEGYIWSNGATSRSIIVKTPGTFTLQTGLPGGCLSQASMPITVSVLPLPPTPTIASSGNPQLCLGQSITLTGPAGFQTYQWSNGATTRNIVVTTAGNYSLSVSSNGICFSAPSNSISVQVSPALEPPTITLNGPSSFCSSDSVSITAPAGFFQYLWSNGATTQNIVVRNTGIYSLIVRNASGCQSSPSNAIAVEVTPQPSAPVLVSPNEVVRCSAPVQLSVLPITGATITWSNGVSGAVINVNAPGVYRAVATIGNCRSDSSQGIRVRQGLIPPRPNYSITGNSRLCPGESVTLTSNAQNVTFQWSNGATTNAITVSNPGIYFVQVRNADGCTNVSDQLIVRRIPATPAPTITPASGGEICLGDSLVLQAQTGNTLVNRYLWSTGDTTRSLTIQTPGIYTVQATDTGGCISQTSLPVTIARAIAPTIDSLILRSSRDSVTAFAPGAVSFIWTYNGTPISGQGASVLFTGSGLYSVRAVGANGCSSDPLNLLITHNLAGKSIQTIHTWPNPTKGVLHISGLRVSGSVPATITYSNGRHQQIVLTAIGGEAKLQVKELPSGLYILSVLNEGKWEQVKFGVE